MSYYEQTENNFSLSNIVKLNNEESSSEDSPLFDKVVEIDFEAIDAAGITSSHEVENLSFYVQLNFSENEQNISAEDLVLNFEQVIAKGLNPVETIVDDNPSYRKVSIDLPAGFEEGEENLSLQEILGDELCRILVDEDIPCAPDQLTVDLGGTVTGKIPNLSVV